MDALFDESLLDLTSANPGKLLSFETNPFILDRSLEVPAISKELPFRENDAATTPSGRTEFILDNNSSGVGFGRARSENAATLSARASIAFASGSIAASAASVSAISRDFTSTTI